MSRDLAPRSASVSRPTGGGHLPTPLMSSRGLQPPVRRRLWTPAKCWFFSSVITVAERVAPPDARSQHICTWAHTMGSSAPVTSATFDAGGPGASCCPASHMLPTVTSPAPPDRPAATIPRNACLPSFASTISLPVSHGLLGQQPPRPPTTRRRAPRLEHRPPAPPARSGQPLGQTDDRRDQFLRQQAIAQLRRLSPRLNEVAGPLTLALHVSAVQQPPTDTDTAPLPEQLDLITRAVHALQPCMPF
jgi:hypothetical protein